MPASVRQFIIVGLPVALGACQLAPVSSPDYANMGLESPVYNAGAPTYPVSSFAQAAPVASGYPAYPAGQAANQMPANLTQTQPITAELEAEVVRLQERLQRMERAMLRLDRRMQLVERNELGRMDDGRSENSVMGGNADFLQENVSLPDGPSYAAGFQPVSSGVTSSLQAGPQRVSGGFADSDSKATVRGFPSLADAPSSSGVKEIPEMAIWTVKYEDAKVWPGRDQLPLSKDIVYLLREKPQTTLFARGKLPNSVKFRDRVKAISRYLSKVASVETVPIATMSANHLDEDTIEILASPQ